MQTNKIVPKDNAAEQAKPTFVESAEDYKVLDESHKLEMHDKQSSKATPQESDKSKSG